MNTHDEAATNKCCRLIIIIPPETPDYFCEKVLSIVLHFFFQPVVVLHIEGGGWSSD